MLSVLNSESTKPDSNPSRDRCVGKATNSYGASHHRDCVQIPTICKET